MAVSAHSPAPFDAPRFPISDVPVPEPTPPQAELEAKLGRAVDPVIFARAARKRLANEPLTPEEEHEIRGVHVVDEKDVPAKPAPAPKPKPQKVYVSRRIWRGLQPKIPRLIPPSDPLEFKRIADARVKRRDKAAKRKEQLARLAKAGSRARARALPRPAEDPAPALDPSPSAEDPCSQS